MKRALAISKRLRIPSEFATKSTAILAQRRKGKSYTLGVLAEECVAVEIPFVILDPTGAHWGLRASVDGKREGLPVYVFGGEHPSDPHLKLERTAGKEIARFVVDFPGYYVIDFKGFDSKEAERQFATDFAETLYRYKGQPGKDFVQHLFVDEADMFVPQRHGQGDNRMVGAFESIVRRGGIRGLGTTLVSQRAAVVNKNVLEQLDILIVLRTVGPNDREAIRKYVVANGTPDEVDALMSSIASLELGEAWIYEPGGEPPLFERVRIRERTTFNSSATPKPGEKRIEPKALSTVELEALRERMAESFERGKAEDPRELQKRIRELDRALKEQTVSFERQLADARSLEREPVVERVPTTPVGLVDALSDAAKRLSELGADASMLCDDVTRILSNVRAVDTIGQKELEARAGSAAAARPAAVPKPARVAQPAIVRRTERPPAPGAASSTRSGDAGGLKRSERAVLSVLAQFPSGRTQAQLALLTGYSARASTIGVALSKLRRLGYATEGQPVRATEDGLAAIAGQYEPLPKGRELLDHWRRELKRSEREVLDVLVDVYPNATSLQEIAERTGYNPDASTIGVALSKLRRLEIADGWRASDDFIAAIGEA